MANGKDAFYFSHDANARSDPKCSALISDFGFEGYGLFWGIVELLSEQRDYKLKKFNKLYEGLARQFMVDPDLIKKLIEALLHEYELLVEDDKYIWSESLLRRMQNKEDKRQAKIDAGRLGGLQSGVSRNKLKQNEAVLEANEPKELKERKVKEEKEDNIVADSEESQLASLLQELIIKNNPAAKKSNLKAWTKEVDLMIRRDNRTREQIEEVIRFSQQDPFWYKNILSMGTLREKFDKLWLQKGENKPRASPGRQKQFDERNYDEKDIEDLYYDPTKTQKVMINGKKQMATG